MLCPHGCGHPTGKGGPHKKENCPPPAGKRGDRYHSLSPKREQAQVGTQIFDVRGAPVKDTGKPSASSDKKAGGKAKVAMATAQNLSGRRK